MRMTKDSRRRDGYFRSMQLTRERERERAQLDANDTEDTIVTIDTANRGRRSCAYAHMNRFYGIISAFLLYVLF